MRPGNKHNKAVRLGLMAALGVLAVAVAGGALGLTDHIASAVDVIWAIGGNH